MQPNVRQDFVPLCNPCMHPSAWDYLKECLDTNWVSTAGPFVAKFQKQMQEYLGVKRAVATSSGTAALHVSLRVAGVQQDDEVLVSALTFIAPANAIRYQNAWPVFIDAEPTYWQMDVEKAIDFLNKECLWQRGTLINRRTKRRVSAVIPVHILGSTVDLEPLIDTARRYELPVIEDASESLGARYHDHPVGTIGDIGCLSFNGNKLLTTGGGGMIVTNKRPWADHASYLVDQAKDDPVRYLHQEIGYNYRLTNIQAALGCSQLENIAHHLAEKRRIATRYIDALTTIPGITPMQQMPRTESAWWLFTIMIDEKKFGMSANALRDRLADRGIQTRPLWLSIPGNPAHADSYVPTPVADRLVECSVSLPCSVGLAEEDQDRVIGALRSLHESTKSRAA